MRNNYNIQLGFMPGRGNTAANFILRQQQEKYLHKKTNTYFTSVDLEKGFNCVPSTVLWYLMQKLGIDK